MNLYLGNYSIDYVTGTGCNLSVWHMIFLANLLSQAIIELNIKQSVRVQIYWTISIDVDDRNLMQYLK